VRNETDFTIFLQTNFRHSFPRYLLNDEQRISVQNVIEKTLILSKWRHKQQPTVPGKKQIVRLSVPCTVGWKQV